MNKNKNKLDIDMSDKTAYQGGHIYFFRSQFEDDSILAFYSENPCGNIHDMDKGWVVIDIKQQQIIDEVETKSYGFSTGEYKDWIKKVRQEHGKTKKVFRYEDGELLWKMEQ